MAVVLPNGHDYCMTGCPTEMSKRLSLSVACYIWPAFHDQIRSLGWVLGGVRLNEAECNVRHTGLLEVCFFPLTPE
jgi:hypothetical protein